MPVSPGRRQAILEDNDKYYSIKTDLGRQDEDAFDRQRFDNFTAFYDGQKRAMAASRLRFFGEQSTRPLYGFEPLSEIKKGLMNEGPVYLSRMSRPQNKMLVQEPSFTSGTVCRRTYDKNYIVVDDKFEDVRTDPFHEPNILSVKQSDHWNDYRSGSRDPDKERKPALWRKLDHQLRRQVPQEMVDSWIRSKRGDTAKVNHDDPTFKVLFKDANLIAKNASTQEIKNLNLDSSVYALPFVREEERKRLAPPPDVPILGEDSLDPIERNTIVSKEPPPKVPVPHIGRQKKVETGASFFKSTPAIKTTKNYNGEERTHSLSPKQRATKNFQRAKDGRFSKRDVSPKGVPCGQFNKAFGPDHQSPKSMRSTVGADSLSGGFIKGTTVSGKTGDGKTGTQDGDDSDTRSMLSNSMLSSTWDPTSLKNANNPEKLQAWRQLAKIDPKSRTTFKDHSMQLKVMQHPPIVPRKVFVRADTGDGWDLEGHRVRMKYSGGIHGASGYAGSWSTDHETGRGIAEFSTAPPPVISSIWDMT